MKHRLFGIVAVATGILVLAGVLLMSPPKMFALAWWRAVLQPEILDIEIGEPFGDAMARSTRKYDFGILLDLQGLELWPGGDGRAPLQIVLRNGDGQSVPLPYQPDSGIIWMYVGVTDEIDLHYDSFIPVDSGDTATTQQPARDDPENLEAVVAIYTAIIQLALRPRDEISCFHNTLEISKQPCGRIALATGGLSPDALRGELRALLTKVSEEEYNGDLTARGLNLGQWWLPNGSLAMMKVFVPQTRSRDMPVRLTMTVNIKDFVRASFVGQSLECYDQQAIYPEKMLYSQTQAAHIFHGLSAIYFPPVVDGERVTDPVKQAMLDWSLIFYNYWQNPANLPQFCDALHRLEREAGYTGPVAPPRQSIDP